MGLSTKHRGRGGGDLILERGFAELVECFACISTGKKTKVHHGWKWVMWHCSLCYICTSFLNYIFQLDLNRSYVTSYMSVVRHDTF